MRRFTGFLVLALGLIAGAAGCSSLVPHALKPSQLWKLNRQAPASGDGYFSIPSQPLPQLMPADLDGQAIVLPSRESL